MTVNVKLPSGKCSLARSTRHVDTICITTGEAHVGEQVLHLVERPPQRGLDAPLLPNALDTVVLVLDGGDEVKKLDHAHAAVSGVASPHSDLDFSCGTELAKATLLSQ